MGKTTIDKTFESQNEKVVITFSGEFIPRDPGVRTFSNGDPGYPPDGPYFEIKTAETNGNIMPLIDCMNDFYDKQFVKLKEKYNIGWQDWQVFIDELSNELAEKLEGIRMDEMSRQMETDHEAGD